MYLFKKVNEIKQCLYLRKITVYEKSKNFKKEK